MKKYTKAKSMQVMVETKTEKAISAIAAIGASVAAKTGPFEEDWISEVCTALRKCIDTLESDLQAQYIRKQPFRLNPKSNTEEV